MRILLRLTAASVVLVVLSSTPIAIAPNELAICCITGFCDAHVVRYMSLEASPDSFEEFESSFTSTFFSTINFFGASLMAGKKLPRPSLRCKGESRSGAKCV